MPKNSGGVGASQRANEEVPDCGIRATGPLPTISEGSEIFSGSLGSLMSEMESIQEILRQQAGQIADLVRQFRSMGEEIKKIQIDRHNDKIERANDKEKLKSYILNLSGRSGPNQESTPRSSSIASLTPRSSQIRGEENGRGGVRDGPILTTPIPLQSPSSAAPTTPLHIRCRTCATYHRQCLILPLHLLFQLQLQLHTLHILQLLNTPLLKPHLHRPKQMRVMCPSPNWNFPFSPV